MVFTIPSCMRQTLIISHRFSLFLLVEIKGYLYRGIGRTYVSLPGRAGGLPVLISDMSAQIASATEQQSAVTSDVTKNVTNVQEITSEGEVTTSQISQASNELALLSSKLKSMITHFKVDKLTPVVS